MCRLNPSSYNNWCLEHENNETQPEFKFKVEAGYHEALSRQIGEAILIEETGTLNSKSEFGMNHLCRMVNGQSPWEEEESARLETETKREKKRKIARFCNDIKNVVMCRIDKSSTDNSVANSSYYRLNKKCKRSLPRDARKHRVPGKRLKTKERKQRDSFSSRNESCAL